MRLKINLCFILNKTRKVKILAYRVVFFFMLFSMMLLLNGCLKDTATLPPTIEFISPAELQLFDLPGEIDVNIVLKGDKPIKFVELSILNQSHGEVFDPVFYYPDSTYVVINEPIFFDLLPIGHFEPFYLQVRVISAAGSNKYLRQIKLRNPELQYNGFYAFTEPTPAQAEIWFYDRDFISNQVIMTTGNYLSMIASSPYQHTIYVSTVNPSSIKAYQSTDHSLLWSYETDSTLPGLTDVFLHSNLIYAGLDNGVIKSFQAHTGVEGTRTQKLTDSIPTVIAVAKTYTIANFKAKSGSGSAIALFLKATGNYLHSRSINYDVLDIYLEKYAYNFLIFGNGQSEGMQLVYHTNGNFFSNFYEFSEGKIRKTVKLNESNFFIGIENRIFQYDTDVQKPLKLLSFNEIPVDFEYEFLSSQLIISFKDRIEIYAYPGLKMIKSISTSSTVKGIELKYSYVN